MLTGERTDEGVGPSVSVGAAFEAQLVSDSHLALIFIFKKIDNSIVCHVVKVLEIITFMANKMR